MSEDAAEELSAPPSADGEDDAAENDDNDDNAGEDDDDNAGENSDDKDAGEDDAHEQESPQPGDSDEAEANEPHEGDESNEGESSDKQSPRSRRHVLTFAGITVVTFGVASLLTQVGGSIQPSSTTSGPAAKPSGAAGKASSQAASARASASAAAASAAAKPDVGVVSCSTSQLGYAAAQLVVANHGPATSSYLVTVDFRSPDGRTITTATTAVERVLPGRRSTPQLANSIDMITGISGLRCSIAKATAYAP